MSDVDRKTLQRAPVLIARKCHCGDWAGVFDLDVDLAPRDANATIGETITSMIRALLSKSISRKLPSACLRWSDGA
ncbi:hypothetical protein EFQ99_16445 [Rhizobium vallis]|uniref:Uncharacterized protein n=1 Tax=Rhizobium vallis TaxID=634290 RepID=A0A3S0QUS8_9HYPH|nr:hypothetical protein EFQ99_16445 [Rhizobium vallis]